MRDGKRERVEVVSSPPQTSALPTNWRRREPTDSQQDSQWLSCLQRATKSPVMDEQATRRRRNPSDETKALRAE